MTSALRPGERAFTWPVLSRLCSDPSPDTHTPPWTRNPWAWGQRLIPTGAHTLLPYYILIIQDPKFPAQMSPCSLLGSLPWASSLVQSMQRSDHTMGEHTPSVRNGQESAIDRMRRSKTGLGYVVWGFHMDTLRLPHDEGWSQKCTVRKAGCEPEDQLQLSPTKPCWTPALQGLGQF